MRARWLSLNAWLATSLLAACSGETRMVLSVDSVVALRDIEVQGINPEGEIRLDEKFDFSAAREPTLPIEFTLSRDHPPFEPVHVLAIGTAETGPTIVAELTTAFVAGETVEVGLTLYDGE